MSDIAIELRGICKRFGTVYANDHIDLSVRRGEILSLLGENGSGKTTLMNILSGIYWPDEGTVAINGKPVNITDPSVAFSLGIGMIHQHFKLVDVFTAVENIVLGLMNENDSIKTAAARVRGIAERYGFTIDPFKKTYDMSVSEKQTCEIIKVLYRGADILILDEPTAVLTPQETEKLFTVLRNMRDDGKAIIIITHKLNEVLELSDRVAVLRKGKNVGEVPTAGATEASLTELMVGEKVVLDIERPDPVDPQLRLDVEHLTCMGEYGEKALDDISFQAYSGEILGIAGVANSGQKQLLESIAGLQDSATGSIRYVNSDGSIEQLIGKKPLQIQNLGIALSFVPEDRLGMGLVGNMNIADNMMLRSYRRGNSALTDRVFPKKLGEDVVEELSVDTPGPASPVRRMSGGNVQKVLVGREISIVPRVLMTAYAVRGLDINSSYLIYHILNEQKKRGTAVIYVGEDLDVLLAMSDRILVLCDGQVSGILDARTVSKETVGLYMTRLHGGQDRMGGKA